MQTYKPLPSPLKYIGSKGNLAKIIVKYLPQHKTYVEVFGGGASLLFAKQPSHIEVYNDIWGDVVNFFKVLRDNPRPLYRTLRYMPYSREEFNNFKQKFLERNFKDGVDWAVTFFVVGWLSINGLFQEFSTSKKADRIRKYSTRINQTFIFSERLRYVTIEKLDFSEAIKKYDSPDTLFYLDPPYQDLEWYSQGFSPDDHLELFEVLSGIEGKAILSYYKTPRVEARYSESGWFKMEFDIPKFSTADKGHQIRCTELLFFNYKPTKTQNLQSLKEAF